jgi:hypothetical protein
MDIARYKPGAVSPSIDYVAEKTGVATAGVQRQYLGCAGKVANGINTVHRAYVRARAPARADRRPAVGARAQIHDPWDRC